MKRYAITGGFATGKSTVSRMIEDLSIPRIDCDVLVHQLMVPNSPVWQQIIASFGETILRGDGEIDRPRLSSIVFKDPSERKRLEAIVHPRVKEAMFQEIAKIENQGGRRVLLEIPLLFEAGWDKEEKFDAVIVVTANPAVQLARAQKKFGLDPKDIQARIASQLPLAEKIKQADFVIDNSGDLDQTKKQVNAIFKKLL